MWANIRDEFERWRQQRTQKDFKTDAELPELANAEWAKLS